MSTIGQKRTPGIKPRNPQENSSFVNPEGLWISCPSCQAILQQSVVSSNLNVCTECSHHFRISSKERIKQFCDAGSFVEIDGNLETQDVLDFYDSKPYAERLKVAAAKTKMRDAFLAGKATLDGNPILLGCFEFSFMGGSMGMVVGEKVARLYDMGAQNKWPVIIFHASGGARMQEGLLSLMQMGKTIVALTQMNEAGVPYISVLTDPTTGGVAASFAMLGDVNIAEPKALIGFAGPRVIEQTIKSKLPEGFQRSEFLLEHGMIDKIVNRHELRSVISRYIEFLM